MPLTPASDGKNKKIQIECRGCGSRVTVSAARESGAHARECLVCPVCWRAGPSFEDALESGAAECGIDEGYRLLGCVRPDGPELDGASREERELARMLWRLAARQPTHLHGPARGRSNPGTHTDIAASAGCALSPSASRTCGG